MLEFLNFFYESGFLSYASECNTVFHVFFSIVYCILCFGCVLNVVVIVGFLLHYVCGMIIILSGNLLYDF